MKNKEHEVKKGLPTDWGRGPIKPMEYNERAEFLRAGRDSVFICLGMVGIAAVILMLIGVGAG